MANKGGLKSNKKEIVSILVVAVMVIVLLFFAPGRAANHPSTNQSTTTALITIAPSQANAVVAYTYPYAYPNSTINSSINATVGSTFIAQISSNAGSTGYDWVVSTSIGIEYLNYTIVSTSNLIGGPQVRDYYFRALQAGNQNITFQDERPWAPGVIAATINLDVHVS